MTPQLPIEIALSALKPHIAPVRTQELSTTSAWIEIRDAGAIAALIPEIEARTAHRVQCVVVSGDARALLSLHPHDGGAR